MRYFLLAPLDRRYVWLMGLATILIFTVGLMFVQPIFALTISPVKMEISGDPGQTLYGQIELFNEQNETKTFYSSTANFEARGETGAPYFLPDIDKGLASWIAVQESVTLQAGESKYIPYTINIPQGTEGGGYFAAILWSVTPPAQDNGQVAIGGRLGMLILLSVSGGAEEGGGLLDFKIEEGGLLMNSLPITFMYRFSNDGSERVRPSGELKIKNLLGFTRATLDANPQKGNVLPQSIRKFSVIWGEETEEPKGFLSTVEHQWRNFALGLYKAELNLVFGNLTEETPSQKAEASYRFFVIPWQLLSIIILILGVVGFIGFIGIKKYNRWIIKKAQAGLK